MTALYRLNDSITAVKGVGPATSEKLSRLGIDTVRDLFRHFPLRFMDFTTPVPVRELRIGETQATVAAIEEPKTFYTGTGKLLTQATAKDSSGKITLTWFNNPYIKHLIIANTTYTIAGKVSFWGKGKTIISPFIEPGNSASINTRGLVPIYPQTAGITSKMLRGKIHELLHETAIIDPLNTEILQPLDLLNLPQAYQNIHFPQTKELHWQADKRLSFNEHLLINIKNQLELLSLGQSISLKIDPQITQKTNQALPFTLTADQQKTVSAIYKDLRTPSFTHRLIQGDTGSGKTATLIFAANQCLAQNKSCAIMAPTEILANQHFRTFLDYSLYPQNVRLITATSTDRINTHEPTIYIGTHALISQLPAELKYPLAFLAIDEQHKFGVNQRDELLQRSPMPHLFNLSATPIPRTVALGLLGDIEISNIRHKPLNRLPTKTFVISPTHFKKSPTWLTEKLASGNQIFVVCPHISEHDTGIASVEKISRDYRKIIPAQYPVLTIHGRMQSAEQNRILNEFKTSGRGVLIATSLIEVGIDIPQANIMIIHSAERFGLASLHQLRGRVGRGEGQGYCFLVPSQDDEEEAERLQLLQKYHSGLILAQKDLRLRGAGEVFGLKQHGALPTRLKYFWSKKLFLDAKKRAKALILKDPQNAEEIARALTTC